MDNLNNLLLSRVPAFETDTNMSKKLVQEGKLVISDNVNGKGDFNHYLKSELNFGCARDGSVEEIHPPFKLELMKNLIDATNNANENTLEKAIQAKHDFLRLLKVVAGPVDNANFPSRYICNFITDAYHKKPVLQKILQNRLETEEICSSVSGNCERTQDSYVNYTPLLSRLRTLHQILRQVKEATSNMNDNEWRNTFKTFNRSMLENTTYPERTFTDLISNGIYELSNIENKKLYFTLADQTSVDVLQLFKDIISLSATLDNCSSAICFPVVFKLATCFGPMLGYQFISHLNNSNGNFVNFFTSVKNNLASKTNACSAIFAGFNFERGKTLLIQHRSTFTLGTTATVILGTSYFWKTGQKPEKTVALFPAVRAFVDVMSHVKLNSSAVTFSLSSTFGENFIALRRGLQAPFVDAITSLIRELQEAWGGGRRPPGRFF